MEQTIMNYENVHNLTKPIVSVIIPTYNRENLITKPIRSVLTQSYQDFEIIVVDDCSTDNTEKVVKSFNDPRIKYIRHQRNSGPAIARNTGIENASGSYIAFLDSDDEWLSEKLEKQLNLFQQCDPEVGVVYTGVELVNEFNQVKRVKTPTYRGFLRERLLYKNVIGTPSTVIVKRNYLEQVKGFDANIPPFVEDADLWLRLSEYCKFEVISEPLVRYSDDDSGNRLTINHKAALEGYLAFLRKHHSKATFNRSEQRGSKISSLDIAGYLFYTGRFLLCNGFLISHSEAIEMGRHYLILSFKANFLYSKSLVYYMASLFGQDVFFNLVNTENTVRSWFSAHISKKP